MRNYERERLLCQLKRTVKIFERINDECNNKFTVKHGRIFAHSRYKGLMVTNDVKNCAINTVIITPNNNDEGFDVIAIGEKFKRKIFVKYTPLIPETDKPHHDVIDYLLDWSDLVNWQSSMERSEEDWYNEFLDMCVHVLQKVSTHL